MGGSRRASGLASRRVRAVGARVAESSATPATFAGFGGPFLLDVLVEAARDGDVGGVVEVGLLSQVILLLVVERV